MRDFFKPWRRKIGVVTLGLALELTRIRRYGPYSDDGTLRPLDDVRVYAYRVEPSGIYAEVLQEYDVTKVAYTIINHWFLPWWSIVLPLTLLSAYLLLSKPRPAKKPKASAPPEPDHA